MQETLPDYESSTTQPIDRERFRVDDDAKATWAMRKLRAIEAKVAENQRIATDERARIDEWLERVNEPLAQDAAYFRGLLIEYARHEREAADRKTVITPYGSVKSRAGQPKWHVDAAVFLDWARVSHPDLIRVKEEPNLTAIKEVVLPVPGLPDIAVTPDGEPVPGITVTPADTSYTVEVDL